MVQFLTRLKPLGRPKQPRPTPKLNNTTIRDFGGGLNVVDAEQSLTSKFSPVFDNMVTYTDRRVSPRYGYEMWLKLKQGTETSGTVTGTVATLEGSRILVITHPTHGFTAGNHVTYSGFVDVVGAQSGITAEMMNRTHAIRKIWSADSYEIIVDGIAKTTETGAPLTWHWMYDTHALGGEPVECRYFTNFVILWSSTGEIYSIDREKLITRIWSPAIAAALPEGETGWGYTKLVAHDVFGKQLICSNGVNKPLLIDFTRPDGDFVRYLMDQPSGEPVNNVNVPAFDACKSAFRFFTVHDTDSSTYPQHQTEIRIAAKDTPMVFLSATDPSDAVDIDMSKIIASPEQTVRGFAIIKDALLVISPSSTTLMKYGAMVGVGDEQKHDPQPIDTLNGFGSNAPRSIVEIGSDVFMIDFNGVPSAKLSTLSNAVVPERVSNYIETMMARHIGRMKKETMRLKTFGFYDGKNRMVHFYLPKFDPEDVRPMTTDPFFFDLDMARHPDTKDTLIMRHDAHLLEVGDRIIIAGATDVNVITADFINGEREIVGVLNENYVLVKIGRDLPLSTLVDNTSGGGKDVTIQPVYDATTGYIYHYVPQLKLTAWSRFKTPRGMRFNCGCGTLEGRSFLFTPDGFMMRYGSPEMPVYGDWYKMYDFLTWTTAKSYTVGDRVLDGEDNRVYKCIANTESTELTFTAARLKDPDAWEEYRGEPVCFAWELPWSDFGARQHTKAIRFSHIDANGLAQFKMELFTDNIYKDAATGRFTPARSMLFVPNEAGAYGAGAQVYGAGRRTREQKLWQMPVKCKLLKPRLTGAVNQSISISAISFLYQKGSVVRG